MRLPMQVSVHEMQNTMLHHWLSFSFSFLTFGWWATGLFFTLSLISKCYSISP